MEADFATLAKTFLDKNGYYYRYFHIELQSHPEYPALSALSDTFDKLHIPHLFTKLSPSHSDKLTGTFLAQLEKDNLPEIFLIQKNNKNILITDQSKNKSSISLREFLHLWTGITILVESKPRNMELVFRKYAPTILSLLFVLLIFLSNDSIEEMLFLLFSAIGFAISLLILKVDLGRSSDVINKLCGKGTKMNCNSIIHSKPSRLLNGQIKLTDLIIVYFSFLLLFQLFFVYIVPLVVLSLLSLPFVLYSLWHQYRLNQWCTLCLLIDSILIVQLSLLFIHSNLILTKIDILLDAIILGVLVILSWLMIKPLIAEWNQYRSILFDLLSIKKDWKILSYYFVHSKSKKLPESYQKFPLIHAKDGIWNLDLILQPTCPNCTAALEKIIVIQEKYKCFNNIRLMIKPEKQNKSNNWDSIISLIYHLHATNDIHEWANYLKSNKSIELENKNIPDNIKENWIVALHHINNWCKDNDLNKSPLILLNQKPLPYHYSPVDFEFWVSKSVNASG